MSDAFEEVEREIQREQISDWLRKYGGLLIIGVIVVLVAVGAITYFINWREDQAAQIGDELFAAQQLLTEDKAAEAQRQFEDIAARSDGPRKAMAEMGVAQALLAQDKPKEALARYEAAAKLTDEPLLRDAALLRAAYIAAQSESYDSLNVRLRPLMAEDAPYEANAAELLAFAALDAGDVNTARNLFNRLRLSLDAPEGIRTRATQMMATIGDVKADPAAKTPPSQAKKPAESKAPAAAGETKQ